MADVKPPTKPISDAAINAVAAAMAKAVHIGEGEPPERDVLLFHERAKLFLAAQAAAIPADKPAGTAGTLSTEAPSLGPSPGPVVQG